MGSDWLIEQEGARIGLTLLADILAELKIRELLEEDGGEEEEEEA